MDNFEEIKDIGKGSFGRVILTKRKEDGALFAIKQIPISGIDKSEIQSSMNEVQVLSLLDHPNIIRYHDSFIDQDYVNIVMEYADGGDLHTKIQTAKKKLKYFSEEEIIGLMLQICEGLRHVQSKNILHRDVKAQNIFLTKDGVVKLGDFGIAKQLTDKSLMAGTMLGTPYNMSPEICDNKMYSEKSDVWALGCILYEMASFKHAFTARNIPALMMKILQGKAPNLPSQYSTELNALYLAIMRLSPEERPSVEEIIEELQLITTLREFKKLNAQAKSNLIKRSLVTPPRHSPSKAGLPPISMAKTPSKSPQSKGSVSLPSTPRNVQTKRSPTKLPGNNNNKTPSKPISKDSKSPKKAQASKDVARPSSVPKLPNMARVASLDAIGLSPRAPHSAPKIPKLSKAPPSNRRKSVDDRVPLSARARMVSEPKLPPKPTSASQSPKSPASPQKPTYRANVLPVSAPSTPRGLRDIAAIPPPKKRVGVVERTELLIESLTNSPEWRERHDRIQKQREMLNKVKMNQQEKIDTNLKERQEELVMKKHQQVIRDQVAREIEKEKKLLREDFLKRKALLRKHEQFLREEHSLKFKSSIKNAKPTLTREQLMELAKKAQNTSSHGSEES